VEAEQEPLALGGVEIGPAAAAALCAAWQQIKQRSLYDSADAFIMLVQEVCVCVALSLTYY
jgi:hypothetical protein